MCYMEQLRQTRALKLEAVYLNMWKEDAYNAKLIHHRHGIIKDRRSWKNTLELDGSVVLAWLELL